MAAAGQQQKVGAVIGGLDEAQEAKEPVLCLQLRTGHAGGGKVAQPERPALLRQGAE